MSKLPILDLAALILVVVGGLNWGLVGFLKYNLVETLFGFAPQLVTIVYCAVGLAALYVAFLIPKFSKS